MLKNAIFEILVSAWPTRYGKHKWFYFLSQIFKIKNCGNLQSKRIGNYRLRLDPLDENDWRYYFGIAGHSYSRLARRLLRRGDCVIDVGANVGYFSAVCAQVVGNSGKVYAIEASSLLSSRLQESVSEVSAGPIKVYHAAAWSSEGPITFYIATNSGWSSLIQNDTFKQSGSIVVQGITLDNFIRREGIMHVRLLKLDIEGAETDALLGAQDSLSQGKIDMVLLEAEPYRLKAFRRSGTEIASLMERHNYSPAAVIIDDRIKPVSRDNIIPGSFNGDYLYVLKPLLETIVQAIFCQ